MAAGGEASATVGAATGGGAALHAGCGSFAQRSRWPALAACPALRQGWGRDTAALVAGRPRAGKRRRPSRCRTQLGAARGAQASCLPAAAQLLLT